jgi:transcriptional regulator with XRE-family HTH domain
MQGTPKADLYTFIGQKIRELRQSYGGHGGISQEALAKAMNTTTNTISRWETGAYKPSANDLHRLAVFFETRISVFFPEPDNPRLLALLSATGDLDDDEFEELRQYAQFRKARRQLSQPPRKRKRS